jgi:hypothetical protein
MKVYIFGKKFFPIRSQVGCWVILFAVGLAERRNGRFSGKNGKLSASGSWKIAWNESHAWKG